MLAVLLIAGSAFIACSSSSDSPEPTPPAPPKPQVYTMTLKANKSGSAATRALDLDGSTLNATWTDGDEVTVYEGSIELGTLSATNSNGTSCTFTGNLNTPPSASGVTLTLKFNSDTYSGQDGTLDYIANHCDYAIASTTVTVKGNTITGSDADFKNQNAIVKFTLKNETGTALPSNPTNLTFQYGTESISLTNIPAATYTANGNGVLFIAVPGISEKDITLTVIGDGVNLLTIPAPSNQTNFLTANDNYVSNSNAPAYTYNYTKASVSFTKGQYYAINVNMKLVKLDPILTPLTIESCSSSKMNVSVTDYKDLYYYCSDFNNMNWVKYDGNDIELSNGEWVSFRGIESTNNNSTNYMHITCSSNCYIYGNVMSLIGINDYATMTTLPYDNTFRNLFNGNLNESEGAGNENQYITHTDGKDLVLPAIELTDYCYFKMFYYCARFNYIKCLATNLSADLCTYEWLKGAGSYILSDQGTCTFVKAAGSNWNQLDYDSGIPNGWIVKEAQ